MYQKLYACICLENSPFPVVFLLRSGCTLFFWRGLSWFCGHRTELLCRSMFMPAFKLLCLFTDGILPHRWHRRNCAYHLTQARGSWVRPHGARHHRHPVPDAMSACPGPAAPWKWNLVLAFSVDFFLRSRVGGPGPAAIFRHVSSFPYPYPPAPIHIHLLISSPETVATPIA